MQRMALSGHMSREADIVARPVAGGGPVLQEAISSAIHCGSIQDAFTPVMVLLATVNITPSIFHEKCQSEPPPCICCHRLIEYRLLKLGDIPASTIMMFVYDEYFTFLVPAEFGIDLKLLQMMGLLQ